VRLRAVTGEPLGFEFSRFDGAGHEDFESAIAEADRRDLTDGQSEGLFEETVEVVDGPVEFFLEGNHAEKKGFGAVACQVERSAGRNVAGHECSGEEGGALVGCSLDNGR